MILFNKKILKLTKNIIFPNFNFNLNNFNKNLYIFKFFLIKIQKINARMMNFQKVNKIPNKKKDLLRFYHHQLIQKSTINTVYFIRGFRIKRKAYVR